MELRQLRYFCTVVEAGSFTAAALLLHMSQPPLSLAITKLERELGVQLLVRGARGVVPTPAGRVLVEAGTRLLGDVAAAVETVRRHGAGHAGSLTIAAVPTLMWQRIPALLRETLRDRPDVDVRLLDPPPWQAIDLLVDHRADIAVLMVADVERFTERYEGALDVVAWEQVPLVAAFALDSAPTQAVVSLADLATEPFVLPRRADALSSLPEVVLAAFERAGLTLAAPRTMETIQTSIPLIEAGVARSILPDPGGETLAARRLAVRPIQEPIPVLHAVAATRAGEQHSPLLRVLLDAVHRTARGGHESP